MCFSTWKELSQNLTSGNSWLPKVAHFLDAAVGVKIVPTRALNMEVSEGAGLLACPGRRCRKIRVLIC